jgi:hypothetical protein
LPANTSVEQVLEELQVDAARHPETMQQLMSIRYYLTVMLLECERRCHERAGGVTNYDALLDRLFVNRKSGEPLSIVTFNYDTLIEKALEARGVPIGSLEDYVRHPYFKVFKLHGSLNWVRESEVDIAQGVRNGSTDLLIQAVIDSTPRMKRTSQVHLVNTIPVGQVGDKVVVPALAIPVQSKLEFECPGEHISELKLLLQQVTKMLVIGWRATEAPFLEMLRKNVNKTIRVTIVAGHPESAAEPEKNLRDAGFCGQIVPSKAGFTEFVLNQEYKEFIENR